MDYDNMPAGEEMDVEVARLVFGQTDFSHLPVVYEEGNTPDGEDGWSGFVCPRCRRSDTLLTHPCVSRYSIDISEAWKIVLKFQLFEIRRLYSGRFVASFGEIACEEDTAELAICRVALKYVSPRQD